MNKQYICTLGGMLFAFTKKRIPKNINRILIFKIGAIGDILMTTPLVRALGEQFPTATIDYCVGKWSHTVLHNNPHLNEIITFDDRIFFDKKMSQMLSLAQKIRKRKYDVVLILDRAWQLNVFSKLFRTFTIGFNRDNEGFANNASARYNDAQHDVHHYLGMGKLLGCATNNTQMEVHLTDEEKKYAQSFWKKNKLTKNVVGLCPGGGKNPGQTVDLKRWPVDNAAALADSLVKKGKSVVLFGGPSDKELLPHFKNKKIHSLIGECSLRETAAVMALCDSVVSNDSGTLHLAAAVCDKVIGLFGPTDPIKLAPLGKNHTYLAKKLECQPCYLNGAFADCWHHRCMRTITPKEVEKYV